MTTENQDQSPVVAHDENKIMAERRAKLAALRQQGNPFPNDFVPQDKAADLVETYSGKTREELEAEPVQVVLAGRMMLRREAGKKAAFATLQDSSGPAASGRIQIYITLDSAGIDAMEALRSYDLGANSYVRKPVDFARFSDVMQQLQMYWLLVNEPARS